MLGTVPESVVWAIFLLPIISLFSIVAFVPKSNQRPAGFIATACIGAAFVLSLWVLDSSFQADGHRLAFSATEWLRVSDSFQLDVVLNIDGLAAMMLVVVTGVSFMVQIYSQSYMAGDTGYYRYFAYMSLFTAAMLGLIMFDSLLLIYVFWEMVGLSSYLLVGFWFDRPAAAAAAKKAFLVTRFADLGFLGAIILIWVQTGTFSIPAIQQLALTGALGASTLTWFTLGIFAGAAGKSAQVPFHVWLPDAMEGPTPVSALIHAATMVAAGVYLVARMYPVFSTSTDTLHVVGAIGGLTAISTALIAIVMTDIKRVLAYSTISQLGYMMLALGTGAYVAAVFHLFTHAFFKALLFLGSGSVNHSTNTFDMRLMGGLRKTMPITFITFLIGSLSLSGIFPFAGFWSKDEILSATWDHQRYLFYIALITAGLTAFYMFRAIFLTFYGEYRGGTPEEHDGTPATHEEHAHSTGHGSSPHESPLVMTLPLMILAIPAIVIGFANINHDFEHLVDGALPSGFDVSEIKFHLTIAVASTILPVTGIVLAWLIYSAKLVSSQSLAKAFGPLLRLLENKYYFDVFYEKIVVRKIFYEGIGSITETFDRLIIDGAVNGLGRGTRQLSNGLRLIQTGQFQAYGALAFSGLIVTTVLVLILSPL